MYKFSPIFADHEPDVRTETNSKGRKSLVIDGHRFHRNGGYNKRKKFLCQSYKSKGCKANCVLNVEDEKLEFTNLNHNHGLETASAKLPSKKGKKKPRA